MWLERIELCDSLVHGIFMLNFTSLARVQSGSWTNLKLALNLVAGWQYILRRLSLHAQDLDYKVAAGDGGVARHAMWITYT